MFINADDRHPAVWNSSQIHTFLYNFLQPVDQVKKTTRGWQVLWTEIGRNVLSHAVGREEGVNIGGGWSTCTVVLKSRKNCLNRPIPILFLSMSMFDDQKLELTWHTKKPIYSQCLACSVDSLMPYKVILLTPSLRHTLSL